MMINFFVFSQEKEPEIEINFLENDNIDGVNINREEFIKSIGLITDYCKNNLKSFPESQKIGILLIAHKSEKASIKCYSNPKLSNELQTKLLNELLKIKIENTKIVDFPIFISINSKNEEETKIFEDFINPVKQKLIEYEKANLETKFKLNKEFAINEVLPVLSAYQIIVDDKFEGVKNFGRLIGQTNFSKSQNINDLTTKNNYYWRGCMEMEKGNQLIPTTKIFGLVSQGELDYSKKYIEIIRMYSDPKTISSYYLEKLNYRIKLFEEELNVEINKGIIEHDKENYDKAISIYNGILKKYPNSSWTLYEKYYSENAKKLSKKDVKDNRSDWDLAKIEIYKHNPLYNMDVRASNGSEAYLMFRRQEIGKLFKNKDERLKDIYKYAEIATDLGVYDFAAQLFWISATFDKENYKKALDNYLYSLDKSGEVETKKYFKGDFEKTFKEINEEKESEMKKSSIYNSMKN